MEEKPMQPEKKKKTTGLKTILLLVAGAIAVFILGLALLIGGIFTGTQKQAKIAEEFIFHMAAEEYDQAHELLTEDVKKQSSPEMLREFAVRWPIMAEVTDVKFTYRGFENNIFTVSGTLTSPTDTSPITVELLKEGDDYKITFFSVNPDDVPKMGSDD